MAIVTEPVCCRVPVSYTRRLFDKVAGVLSELHTVYGFYRTNASQDNHITRNDNIYPHIIIPALSVHDTVCVCVCVCVHISHKMKSLVLCEQLIYETVKPWDGMLCHWG